MTKRLRRGWSLTKKGGLVEPPATKEPFAPDLRGGDFFHFDLRPKRPGEHSLRDKFGDLVYGPDVGSLIWEVEGDNDWERSFPVTDRTFYLRGPWRGGEYGTPYKVRVEVTGRKFVKAPLPVGGSTASSIDRKDSWVRVNFTVLDYGEHYRDREGVSFKIPGYVWSTNHGGNRGLAGMLKEDPRKEFDND